jgi:hypothetical protein
MTLGMNYSQHNDIWQNDIQHNNKMTARWHLV